MKNIGGISTSVANFINEIHELHQITLVIPTGYIHKSFMIPENVTIINGSSWIRDCIVSRENLSWQTPLEKVIRNIRRIIRRFLGNEFIIAKGLSQISIPDSYDVAIAFANNSYDAKGSLVIGGDYDLVLNNVNSKRKIAWIHNDIRKCNISHSIGINIFKNFDFVVNVSMDCKKIFDSILPEYKEKSKMILNMYNINRIKTLSDKPVDDVFYKDGVIQFVTVARISNYQKKINRIVDSCIQLKNEGYTNFQWVIVGDGIDRIPLMEKTKRAGIKNLLVFIGQKNNPYPYMKRADAFILSSLYEGLPMTIKEAQILGTPTFSTRFGAAEEAIIIGKQGDICENSAQGLHIMVKTLLNNPKVLQQYRKYLSDNPINNNIAISQFENLIKL